MNNTMILNSFIKKEEKNRITFASKFVTVGKMKILDG